VRGVLSVLLVALGGAACATSNSSSGAQGGTASAATGTAMTSGGVQSQPARRDQPADASVVDDVGPVADDPPPDPKPAPPTPPPPCKPGVVVDFRDGHDHLQIEHRCRIHPALIAEGRYQLTFHSGRPSQYRSVTDASAGVRIRLAPGSDRNQTAATSTSQPHLFEASYESVGGVFRMPNADTQWSIGDVSPGDEVVITWDCDNTRRECE
jgi:hypothetical protein